MEQRVRGDSRAVEGGNAPEVFLSRLEAEHRALEQRLTELESHIGLTAEEQRERIQIKKLKLAKKDLILRQKRLLQATSPPQAQPLAR
jgi:hypothetical protein